MPFRFKKIEEIGDVKGKRVIIRVDFNVPCADGKIFDDFRVRKTLPTINFLRDGGAKIFLISHFGSEQDESIKILADYCQKYFPVIFSDSIESARAIEPARGEVVLLENLRRLGVGEENNDPSFAEELASLGEIYVNEAFSVSHRSHASIVGVPKFRPSFAGLLFSKEVENLSKAFKPDHPFIFVSGGKKAETKIPLIEKFFSSADKIFVGGVLANDFLRFEGFSVGQSTISKDVLIKSEWIGSPKLVLPTDVVVDRNGKKIEVAATAVAESDKIVDAGESFVKELRISLKDAKLVIWNGPLGLCEGGFCLGTDSVAEAITDSKAFSIVGGGDTEAEIDALGLVSKFSFISTGGGAMLQFLAKETLPGIEALESSKEY